MPREGGPSSNHRRGLLDRPPEFIIGPAFGRTRWRTMAAAKKAALPPPLTRLLRRLGRRRTHLGIVQVDVEAERAHFLDQHVERFRDTGFERVVAAHDR